MHRMPICAHRLALHRQIRASVYTHHIHLFRVFQLLDSWTCKTFFSPKANSQCFTAIEVNLVFSSNFLCSMISLFISNYNRNNWEWLSGTTGTRNDLGTTFIPDFHLAPQPITSDTFILRIFGQWLFSSSLQHIIIIYAFFIIFTAH